MGESDGCSPEGAAPEAGSRKARANFQRFVGVDLGGGRGKNTAVARLELTYHADGRPRLAVAEAKIRQGQRGTGAPTDEAKGGATLFRDDVLLAYLGKWVDDDTVVAMNAPLTLPPCVRCTLPCPTVPKCTVPVVQWMRRWAPRLVDRGRSDPSKPAVTPYTQRATELVLVGAGYQPRETLGQGTGPLAARAAYLRRAMSPVLRLHENLIEVHPRATLVAAFGRNTADRTRHGADERVRAVRKEVLVALTESIAFDYVWPELVVRNTHVFNAVLCAFTAFWWAQRGLKGPADLRRAPADPIPPGSVATTEDLSAAIDDLGTQWLEDGWVWAPAPTRRR